MFHENKVIQSDSIITARTDPKYDYLCNLYNNPIKWEKLETMIGQNIPLPKLGEIESYNVPKDYDPKIPYLLTRQRYEVLKKVVERGEGGYVLSGPHGVSKSYTMCLLAAYAIVNSIPLLYVPRCAVWVSEYKRGGKKNGKKMANDFLRCLVLEWNSDILSEHDIQELRSSDDVVDYMSKNIAKNKSVFYLFDDHNELFRTNSKGKMSSTKDYFMDYTRWTGVTSGDKTMTIYCGSAHSKFEYNLPGGAESKLIRIIPPSPSEFEVLIKDFGFNLDKHRMNRVEYATGRMPRELKLFADYVKRSNHFTDEQIRLFVEERKDMFSY